MAGTHSYEVGVIFASLVGAAGFPLAVLAWRRFQGTPFGRILAVLPVFMLVGALYHPILLVYPSLLEFALLVETLGFALLVVFAIQAIRVHRRMSPHGSRGERGAGGGSDRDRGADSSGGNRGGSSGRPGGSGGGRPGSSGSGGR